MDNRVKSSHDKINQIINNRVKSRINIIPFRNGLARLFHCISLSFLAKLYFQTLF